MPRRLHCRMRDGLVLLAWVLSALAWQAWAGTPPADPLGSSRWPDMRRTFFGDAPVSFDSRVEVVAPETAEDSMNVPVSVRVTGGLAVKRILVFAEKNPIVPVLEFVPEKVSPYIAFRMKIQQRTPVRAAAQDPDGAWHVGGVWVDAAGGGCTQPGTGRAQLDWQAKLNRVEGRFWSHEGGDDRLRLRINHPMDTGLAANIPAFYLQRLVLKDEAGTEYLRLEVHQPVSQNPVFSFDIPNAVRAGHSLHLTGVDSDDNHVDRALR